MAKMYCLQRWWLLFGELLLISMTFDWGVGVRGEIKCPSYLEIPSCSCYILDEQLDIQCSAVDVPSLQKSLQALNGPVKSFGVYDLDSRATVLPNGVTDNVTSPIFHLQLSHSSLEDLALGSLRGISSSLESLAIISARLKSIPHQTLSTMKRLRELDLEGNLIQELGPYSFHNILLQKVNLKGNQLENITEHAFWGVEETLMDIDMSENKLKTFPYLPLRRLRLLQNLNLAWNEMNDLSILTTSSTSSSNGNGNSGGGGGRSSSSPINNMNSHNNNNNKAMSDIEWPLLKYLNLNSNYLRKLTRDTFSPMRNLKLLSIHLNSIENVDESAFLSLTELESIDLSHNKITILGPSTFRHNLRLVNIDLSNNHLHLVDELFNNLSQLRELFLNGNNILHLTSNTFLGSEKISLMYLQGNALRFVESGVFTPLRNLTELRLSDNFLDVLPQDLFLHNEKLFSLSLDGNQLTKVVPGSFHNCKGLRELRLQNNRIMGILPGVLDVLPLLEEIYLENNKLTQIKGLDSLRNVRHVSLSRNSLERLTADMLPGTELSSLSLGHNMLRIIEDGAFSNQTSLNILFLGNNRLTHLGGKTLSGLKNLERLYLQKNNISLLHNDCFHSQTRSLTYIDLSYNSLRTVSRPLFTKLESVTEINLSHNDIATLEDGAFTGLRTLRVLDLSYNRLSLIDFPNVFQPSGLEIFKICCNLISDIRISSSSPSSPSSRSSSSSSFGSKGVSPSSFQIGLKELDLRQNQLIASTLQGMEMGRLEVLQVSGNNLTDLTESMLGGFPSLSFLAAENAHITNLPGEIFRKNPNLAVLRLSDNYLTSIPDTVFSTTLAAPNGKFSVGPRELHLRNNRLRHFPYKALANASSLQVLTLSGNWISTLELNKIRLPRLKQLDMNDNQLIKFTGPSTLTKSMPTLEVIDLGQNNISRLSDDFLRNVSLTQINLGGNAFQKIPFALSTLYVPNPFVLNMSGNPLLNFYTENHPSLNFSVMDLYLCETNVSFLTTEEFKIYPHLHRLVIRNNPLSSLPTNAFTSLPHLNLLDLSENEIDDLKYDSFSGLVQLKSLNLSHNRLKNLISFHSHMTGLQDLDLSHNQLSQLVPEAFTNLISLVSLRLRGNQLTSLPADLFGPLARLSVLDLSANYIETVPATVLRHLETRISTLRLEDNPLSCECDSKEFRDWLQLHPKIFVASTSSGSSSTSSMSLSSSSSSSSLLSSSGLSGGEPNFVCDRPDALKGRSMMESDLPALCTSPAIVKLAIQDVQPSSAVVSWQGRNISGFVVAYHALNHNNQVKKTRQLPASSRAYRLPDLQSDTPYLICVLGLAGDENSADVTSAALSSRSADTLRDSPFSKCTKMRTLQPASESETTSIFHRRLGVLVGACVGIIVFVLLISSIACVKYRKRRSHHQQQNGKVDHRVTDALTATNNTTTASSNNVGTLLYNNHHHHPHHHLQGGVVGVGVGGSGNGGTLQSQHHHHHHHGNGNGTPGNLSPEFLTYRHYSITTDGGLHPSHTTTTELERL